MSKPQTETAPKVEHKKLAVEKGDQHDVLDKGHATKPNGDDLHKYVPGSPHDVPVPGTPKP